MYMEITAVTRQGGRSSLKIYDGTEPTQTYLNYMLSMKAIFLSSRYF
jgi:hypothetical protein